MQSIDAQKHHLDLVEGHHSELVVQELFVVNPILLAELVVGTAAHDVDHAKLVAVSHLNVIGIGVLGQDEAGLALDEEVDVFDLVSFEEDVLLLGEMELSEQRADPRYERALLLLQQFNLLELVVVHIQQQLLFQVVRELFKEGLDFLRFLVRKIALNMALALNEERKWDLAFLVYLVERLGLGVEDSVLGVVVGEERGHRPADEGKRYHSDDHDDGAEDLLLRVDP